MNFWLNLLNTSDFPARWYCGRWTAGHGWLHILSDIGIWSAYFAIPCVLLYFSLERKDLPFRRIFYLFGAFILLCGLTHLMEAIIFWWPAYRLAGVLKFITAVVSWVTVFALFYVAPRAMAMAMRSPEELDQEIQARKKAEEELLRSNNKLEQRVLERTAQLRAEREWFSTTLSSIGDGVITTDTSGNVITLNSIAEQLTGWTQADSVGKSLTEIFQIVNEKTREPVENPVLRALEQGRIVGLANHTILISRTGQEWYIDDSAAPIKDTKSNIIGAVLVFRDITEKYLNEQERQKLSARLKTLVQYAPIEIALFDEDLRFVDINNQIPNAHGLPREQHLGKRPSELYPENGVRVEHYLQQVLSTREPIVNVEVTGTFSATSDNQCWIASYYPIFDELQHLRGIGSLAVEITDRKRTEQALQNQYDLTKAITDNATTAIFMVDSEGRCTFMNPAAESMTGYTWSEVEGNRLHDLIHYQHPDGSPYPIEACPIDCALPEHAEIRQHEDYYYRKNGERFPVLCNARPIYENGRLVGTVVEVQDLTEQKHAMDQWKESEQRFQQLADAIPQMAWMARPDGFVDWYNSRWYEYTGTSYQEMEGWGWQKVHHPESLPEVIATWNQSLASGKPFDMVFPLRNAAGEYRPFLTRGMPFRDEAGNIVRWFGTNTDISEQKKVEDDLKESAQKLSEADRLKDEFLATLAHELRNPLAPIRTGLEVIKMMQDDPEAVEEVRSIMERQVHQMITLIDDLLDVSRITRGKLEMRLSRIETHTIIQSAVEASKPFIDELNHTLTVSMPEEPIYLKADPNRMAQVLSNLLNNAAKYTPRGGRIDLTVESNPDEVIITVADTGIGIPHEMLERIFEMFTQIDRSIEKGYTGLGIGLTLVKRIVEMHEGFVDVHSEGPDQGSEFIVRLPLYRNERAEVLAEQSTEFILESVPKCRILIVDDNEAAADMLGKVVEMLGHDVRVAHDGEQAITVAAEFLPEVILMDLGMPRMTGYQAAQYIRQQSWGKDLLLIALTGWGQDEDKRKTKEAGFDHHLTKPAEPAQLQRILADYLQKN